MNIHISLLCFVKKEYTFYPYLWNCSNGRYFRKDRKPQFQHSFCDFMKYIKLFLFFLLASIPWPFFFLHFNGHKATLKITLAFSVDIRYIKRVLYKSYHLCKETNFCIFYPETLATDSIHFHIGQEQVYPSLLAFVNPILPK